MDNSQAVRRPIPAIPGGGSDVIGVVIEGLDATPNGNVDTSVLDFTGASVEVITDASGNAFALASTQDNGTIVTIEREGVYIVELGLILAASADVLAGIAFNAQAAELTAAPSVNLTRTKAAGLKLTAAGTQDTLTLRAAVVINNLQASDPTQGLVRALCTATGGGAPAGINLAATYLRIDRVGSTYS